MIFLVFSFIFLVEFYFRFSFVLDFGSYYELEEYEVY